FNKDEDGPARLEGFEPAQGWAGRAGPAAVEVDEDGVRFAVTLGVGHKTGLYLDQRANRCRVAGLAANRDVLDAFCYTGGFACHALRGGARRAVLIESSPEALAGARQNLALNGVAERAEIVATNAFDELRRLERAGARFGVVVLDPPPFARSRTRLDAAMRGYKEINLRAMRLLERGGSLLTFSCSHHVSEARSRSSAATPRPTRERGSGWSPRSPRRATTLPFSRFQRLGTSKASTWKRCAAAPRAGGGLPGTGRLDHAARARIARRGWAPPRRSNVRIRRGVNGPRLPPPRQATTRSEGAASPAPGLAVLQHPDALGVEVEPTRFSEQARGRLLERLLGQIKGAPVDRHEVE